MLQYSIDISNKLNRSSVNYHTAVITWELTQDFFNTYMVKKLHYSPIMHNFGMFYDCL